MPAANFHTVWFGSSALSRYDQGVIRLLAAVIALSVLLSSAGSLEAEELTIPFISIQGAGIEGEIRVPAPDADAFRRRINLPPRIEEPESLSGPVFQVTSDYWEGAVRREEEGDDARQVEPRADYYPEDGYIRAALGETDAWMVLDLRQRAILNRTIELAQAGRIDQTPSSVDVISAAMDTELISVSVAGEIIEADAAREVLTGLATANPDALQDPRVPVEPTADEGFWLIVTLPEGHARQYYYDGATTVYEALGTERYDATSVAPLLNGLAPESTLDIEQQEPVGGLYWWPLTIGGGLGAIALAVWFRRRFPTAG